MSNETKTPDFGYLETKEPSDLHTALKAFIEDHGGPEMDLKTIQVVLSAHGKFQKSDYNKQRENYRERSAVSIYKGGRSTTKHWEERAAKVQAEAQAKLAEQPESESEPEPKAPVKPKVGPKTATKATATKAEQGDDKPAAKATPTRRRTRKTVAA